MIKMKLRAVYYAPSCGRSFLTKRGACMAQAKRALRDKYGINYDRETGDGFDPIGDESYMPLLNRYYRVLMKSVVNEL